MKKLRLKGVPVGRPKATNGSPCGRVLVGLIIGLIVVVGCAQAQKKGEYLLRYKPSETKYLYQCEVEEIEEGSGDIERYFIEYKLTVGPQENTIKIGLTISERVDKFTKDTEQNATKEMKDKKEDIWTIITPKGEFVDTSTDLGPIKKIVIDAPPQVYIFPLFPESAIRLGSTWSYEVPIQFHQFLYAARLETKKEEKEYLKAFGNFKVKIDFKLVSSEKRNNYDCVRIDYNYRFKLDERECEALFGIHNNEEFEKGNFEFSGRGMVYFSVLKGIVVKKTEKTNLIIGDRDLSWGMELNATLADEY